MTLRDQLKRDEGKSAEMYLDSRGFLTIGYGHLLRGGPPLSDAAMEQILGDDLLATTQALRDRLPWVVTLSSAREGALVNMAFNMGVGGVAGFKKMLAALQAQEWDTAARELLDSKYATQVGERATRLAQQLITDTWV